MKRDDTTGTHRKDDEPEDLISISQLMQVLAEEPDPADSDDDDTIRAEALPRVMRMPEGIEVTERHLGHAVGHWVLQVRCVCGRRWFEVEPVPTADCPRCGALVLIDIDER